MSETQTEFKIDWTHFITEALNAPGALGNTYNRFRAGSDGKGYSMLNQFWLYAQGINEPAAPFGTWKALGRNIIKGHRGKTVLHPKMITITETDERTGVKSKKRIPVGFVPKNTAFALSDTEGPELVMPEVPEWSLDAAAAALNITQVDFAHLDGNTQGYSFEVDGRRHFAINPLAAYPLKTALHELAHIVLRHTSRDEHGHRGVQEFQAEAVAYLAAKELELTDWNPAESRAYIQGWLSRTGVDTEDLTDAQIRQVFGAVDKILQAGRTATGQEDAAELAA